MSNQIADQATGCRERAKNGGQFYDSNGNKISDTAAKKLFREGQLVAAPNAGAGSYNAILKRLGFHKVEVDNWSSSAGDWTFKVQGNRFVNQTNRYPHHGFAYYLCYQG